MDADYCVPWHIGRFSTDYCGINARGIHVFQFVWPNEVVTASVDLLLHHSNCLECFVIRSVKHDPLCDAVQLQTSRLDIQLRVEISRYSLCIDRQRLNWYRIVTFCAVRVHIALSSPARHYVHTHTKLIVEIDACRIGAYPTICTMRFINELLRELIWLRRTVSLLLYPIFVQFVTVDCLEDIWVASVR